MPRSDLVRGGTMLFESPRGLHPETARLVEALPRRDVASALFGMDTEAAAAMAARALWPDASVAWFHLDAYVAAKARRVMEANGVRGVDALAAEDPPAGPYDLVALPFAKAGESLLMRDLVEAAHDRLRIGGRLVASTDGGPDALRRTIEKVFGNVVPTARFPLRGASFYALRRREAPAASDHAHVFPVEFVHDAGAPTQLVLETRPGTFSHGTADRGTRALAESLDPGGAASVLDLGAGCGALGLALAMRLPAARVVLVDSNARAIGCARRNAGRNGVADRVEAIVRADLEDVPAPAEGFALAVANPPYFSRWRIAQRFVERAHALLAPGGRLALVVRVGEAADQHAQIVREGFGDARIAERDGYGIVTAVLCDGPRASASVPRR